MDYHLEPTLQDYHAIDVANEFAENIDTGNAAATSSSEDRRSMTDLLTLVLGHLCVKMFWRSLYAIIPQVETEEDQIAFGVAAMSLFFTDALVQFFFMECIQLVSKSRDLELRHIRGGIAFVIAYTLWFLPSATEMIEIFRIGTWVNFVFNVGCLVELRLGLIRKGVDALVASW
ncbi:hypothetical protein SLS64_004157 [Diaporthe eres]|uniref:Uncharacterized protein n=1 Tax=Diaporthe eres TaxID=83184 RepID=A0ABR1PLF6_DIAER